MNRILTFHHHNTSGSEFRMAPAYYADADYEKVAVRIYAEKAPTRDAEFDIFDDGVSIFNRNLIDSFSLTSGERTIISDKTTISLMSGENSEEIADDFNITPIEQGSWIYCNLVDAGGGSNFTVQLELRPMSEDEEDEED